MEVNLPTCPCHKLSDCSAEQFLRSICPWLRQCLQRSNRYNYAAKHNPMVFFTDTNGGDNATPSNPLSTHYAPLQQLMVDLDNKGLGQHQARRQLFEQNHSRDYDIESLPESWREQNRQMAKTPTTPVTRSARSSSLRTRIRT